jgi:hypothetical protein
MQSLYANYFLRVPFRNALYIQITESCCFSISATICGKGGLTFPHKRIKAPAGFKAQAAIEFYRFGIGFSHGKAQTQEVAGAQFLRAQSQKRFANPAAAKLRQHADLRYVPNVLADARAEQQAGNRARGLVQRHKRRVRVKHSATGKADNIIQEAQRAVQAAVLIVDF